MMNPIIDIIATAKPAETAIPGALPAPSDSGTNGLFAQAIAAAIGSISAQAAAIPVVPALFSNPTAAPSKGEGTFSERLFNNIAAQSEPEAVPVPAANDQTETTTAISDLALNLVDTSTAVIAPTGPKPSPQALPSQPALSAPRHFARTEVAPLSLPSFLDQPVATSAILQNAIETALTPDPIAAQKPATITAQVEISNEAAAVIVSDPMTSLKSESPAVGVTDVLPRAAAPRSGASLKAQLRREFPMAKLESASGKVNVAIKLSDSQPATALPQTEAKAAITTAKTVELPIVTSNQMARPVMEVAGKKNTQKSTREATPTVKSNATALSKTTAENPREIRQQATSGVRKPVLQALKSQGFDFEKLLSKPETESPITVAGLSEKSTATLSETKSTLQVLDRSSELNGIERFKLDIKRGHIEALLKKGEIKLQLQPDHLGSLKIKLMTTPTETSARLETSSEDARRAVEASLPALRESFERAGLKLNSVEVVVGNDSDSRRQSAFQQEANARNASTKRQALRGQETIPLISEIENPMLAHHSGALNLVA